MSQNPPYEILLGKMKMFGLDCLSVAIKFEDLPKFQTTKGKTIPKEVIPILKQYSHKTRVGAIIDPLNRILELIVWWKPLKTTRKALDKFEELISTKGKPLFVEGIMTYSFE